MSLKSPLAFGLAVQAETADEPMAPTASSLLFRETARK
jgi:hypothetical protein